MSKVSKCLVLLSLVALMGSVASAQNLKNLVEQEGFAWLVGHWKTTTDDGQDISLNYRWAVEGNAVIVDLKIGDITSHGMIYLLQDTQQVKQISVDSKGRVTNSTWDAQYGDLILKTSITNDEGQTQKMGVTFEKVDATTMTIKLYDMQYGELSYEPWAEMEFKREK